MSQRKMVSGLAHEFTWSVDDTRFFEAIDASGGWPIGYQYVGFEHTDSRAAGFTNSPRNDGWWTVIACADDYYMWKLSPKAIKRIADAALDAAQILRPDVSTLLIRNSSGHRAAIAKTEGDEK